MEFKPVNVLVDSGAQGCLMTERLASNPPLKIRSVTMNSADGNASMLDVVVAFVKLDLIPVNPGLLNMLIVLIGFFFPEKPCHPEFPLHCHLELRQCPQSHFPE